MRVIAGTARGTRLIKVPGGIRPLSDRAREGLFSSLGELVEGARCADLFAGTGAVGIEALSRGAASCDFVDSSVHSVRAIRENLSRSRLQERARVTRADVLRFLGRGATERWDLAFLDPPYAFPKRRVRAALESLHAHVATGASVLLTRPARDATDVIPVHFRVTKRLSYGDARILVLEGQ